MNNHMHKLHFLPKCGNQCLLQSEGKWIGSGGELLFSTSQFYDSS